MKKIDAINYLIAVLVLLLMYTGATKWADFEQFERSIHLQHFPLWLERLLIYSLPGSEMIAALLMVFDRTRIAGLWLSLSLLTAFTIYVAAAVLHILERTPCPCGGALATLTWPQHLLFNLSFLAANVTAILLAYRTGIVNYNNTRKDISRAK